MWGFLLELSVGFSLGHKEGIFLTKFDGPSAQV